MESSQLFRLMFAGALWFAAQTLNAAEPWKLVWSDEFNGTKLDFTKWAV